jgi:hypothetical protein
VLPAVLRAVFVADWNPEEPRRPFEDRAVMTQEVRALRADHNFAPETAIQDVARALRRHVDEAAFDRVLESFRQAPGSSGDHDISGYPFNQMATKPDESKLLAPLPNHWGVHAAANRAAHPKSYTALIKPC